jgi:hypothetical protein
MRVDITLLDALPQGYGHLIHDFLKLMMLQNVVAHPHQPTHR